MKSYIYLMFTFSVWVFSVSLATPVITPQEMNEMMVLLKNLAMLTSRIENSQESIIQIRPTEQGREKW